MYAGLDPAMPISAFQAVLHEKTGVMPSHQEILCGFPPKQAMVSRIDA